MTTRARHRSAGFTLIEVVIVMAILIILAAAAIPNVMGGFRDQPIMMATNATIDVFTFARVRAVNDFRAYGVRVAPDEGEGGLISVHAGTGPACSTVGWGVPVRTLDFGASREFGALAGDGPDVRIVQLTPARDVFQVCFTPDGRTLDMQTMKPVAPEQFTDYAAGDLIVSISAHHDEAPVGMLHHVIVPYSGSPRWTFGEDHAHPEGGEGGS